MDAFGEGNKETSHLEIGDKKIIAFIDIGTNSLRWFAGLWPERNNHHGQCRSLPPQSHAEKKKHPGFAALDKRSQNTVRVFAMLLRLAESMDCSHTGAISHASFREGEENNVILCIQADHDPQLELWGVQNHRANFQKVFKRKLIVEAEIGNKSKIKQ